MRPEQEKAMHEQLAAAKEARIGAAGIPGNPAPSENFFNQAQTADPRGTLLYSIGVKVDELLHQVSALREAERLIKNADYHTVYVLDKLMSGGLGR